MPVGPPAVRSATPPQHRLACHSHCRPPVVQQKSARIGSAPATRALVMRPGAPSAQRPYPGSSIQLMEDPALTGASAPPPGGPPPPPALPPPSLLAPTNYRTQTNETAFRSAVQKGRARYADLSTPMPPPTGSGTFDNSYISYGDTRTGHVQTHFLKQTVSGESTRYEPLEGYGYESEIDLNSGTAKALVHSRSKEQGEISGSEIIYHQYQDMASVVGVPTPPMRRLIRSNVVSATGAPVIHYIHGSSDRLTETREFFPTDEAFFALLGIENLSSAVFLVRQRGRELGITGIERLTLEGEKVIVHFTGA